MKKKGIKYLLLLLLVLLIGSYFIPSSKIDFQKAYKQQDKASESLKEFRARKVKTILIDGINWEYYSGGKGNKTILFLHGMGGSYDLWWQQINALENEYKIITYSLPEAVNNLKQTSKGILKILEIEEVDSFYLVGTSMGGYISQYLVKTVPNRVEKVVFGNTFPPNELIITKNKKKSKIVPLLPEILIFKMGEKKLKTELLPAAKNSKLLKAFLPSLPFSKRQFVNRYAVVIDRFKINPLEYNVKRIPKLIIESDNDPLVALKLREGMKGLYPATKVFTFNNEGHFPYINAADSYNKILKGFFNEASAFEEVEKTIQNYFNGRKAADIVLLEKAFSKKAKLYTVVEGKELVISLEKYFSKVKSDGQKIAKTTILSGDITEGIANFKTEFMYANKTYKDYLTLIKTDKGWKIITKTFIKTE